MIATQAWLGPRAVLARLAFVAVTAVLVGACGDVCEEASEKLRSCEPEPSGVASSQSPFTTLPMSVSKDCPSDYEECIAPCIAEASCAAILHVRKNAGRRSSDPNAEPLPEDAPRLFRCVSGCMEKHLK